MNKDELTYKDLIKRAKARRLGFGVKFTKKNGDSWASNSPVVNYKVGKTVEIPDAPIDGRDCGRGLHLGKGFIGAGNYCLPEKIFFCTFKKTDLCGEGVDKVRVKKLKVESELSPWMGYGKNGKKILDKIGKKFNPEDYNPYQSNKLPNKKQLRPFVKKLDQVWNQVGNQVRDQVGDQVGNQVRNQVWNQVWNQVGDQVGNQVWDQVGNQVWDQVGNQVWNQVRDQVRDQVWDQVRTTSCWAINLHFDLGVYHWFGDLLKLGVMLIFVKGKIKVFGKMGKYLGEYDEEEFI